MNMGILNPVVRGIQVILYWTISTAHTVNRMQRAETVKLTSTLKKALAWFEHLGDNIGLYVALFETHVELPMK